jgi:hypothetical protein
MIILSSAQIAELCPNCSYSFNLERFAKLKIVLGAKWNYIKFLARSTMHMASNISFFLTAENPAFIGFAIDIVIPMGKPVLASALANMLTICISPLFAARNHNSHFLITHFLTSAAQFIADPPTVKDLKC